ncbi:MAG: VWA domain-containing protein [Nannocystaceae bacterium]|nr:VWA domain-containing protein [Nannocystaceae bacterium]
MTITQTTKLAALIALLPSAFATGCNAHPTKDVEYQTGGGIDVDGDGESGDAGDDASGDDEGDGSGEGDGADDGSDDDGPNHGEGDDGGADGGDGGEPGEPTCTSSIIDVAANPPEVMLVLDKSTSMVNDSWMHNGNSVRRWESLHAVVSEVATRYEGSMNFGAVLFPSLDAQGVNSGFSGSCRMADAADVHTAANNASEILAAMPNADDFEAIRGRTPARAGIELAAANLAALQSKGGRAMILVTDGLANCASEDQPNLYDQSMPAAVAAAAAQQIPTYVVGIDIRDEHVSYADANALQELNTVALAGGVPASAAVGEPAFYDASDETALHEALDAIAARVECTIPLTEPAPQDAIVTITVDDEEVSEISDCVSEDGWLFTDSNARASIELCGTACEALRVTGFVETTACGPNEVPDVPSLPVP